ncbi:hypothetical protein Y1Q_0017207 [Alligator mississippiensis]|uniref:Uncharacterized protein n=1 Tax=Alligator mississippiensis TaxID=8496 RepID=A0A151NKQ9_ALLMI|nr:hypothetical protein Y1Q_0017207 [Alligator mississippiensis]
MGLPGVEDQRLPMVGSKGLSTQETLNFRPSLKSLCGEVLWFPAVRPSNHSYSAAPSERRRTNSMTRPHRTRGLKLMATRTPTLGKGQAV